ncbi:MAG TPA: PAS domain S-box protein [Syntrophales bacterium]|nr:PAS domain S-box protein [Syntrophales bacterium]
MGEGREEVKGQGRDIGVLMAKLAQLEDALLRFRRAGGQEAGQGREKDAAFLRAVLEGLTDMVFVLDASGRFLFATPSAEKILGYRADQMVDMDPFSLVHPDDLPLAREEFSKVALGTNDGTPTELRLRRADGSWLPVEVWGRSLLADPAVGGFVITIRDISPRVAMREQLYRTLAINRAMIDAMRGAALIMDLEGRVLAANRYASRALGRQIREVVGAVYYDLLPPAWKEVWRENVAAAAASRRPVRFEKAIDNRFYVNEIHPIYDDRGTISWIAIFQHDITRYRRAEERLRREERFLRTVIDAVPAFIGIRDRTGRYELVNETVARAYGTTVEGMVGKTDVELKVPREQAERFLAGDREVMATKRPLFVPESPCTYADGTLHWLSTYKIPLFNEDGECDRVLSVALDRTFIREAEEERKRLRTQLLQAQKLEAVGTMAGGLAHDFNNILMGLQGLISLLLLEGGQDQRLRDRLREMEIHIRRGSDITKQLLNFSTAGRSETRATDLNLFLAKALHLFERTHRGVMTHLEAAPSLPTVEINEGQMDQVFMNLFINADQAMPGGGNLFVTTSYRRLNDTEAASLGLAPGGYVAAAVTDTGTGMEPEIIERIFDPFFTTKPKGVGTGLGLASAYGIVKNHGGAIAVESLKGRGSTFTVFLPAAAGATAREEGEERPPEGPLEGTETLLLVDDEEINLQVMREILEILGYRTLRAASGQEALAVYAEKGQEIDLVVMDLVMPGMGGAAAFEAMREFNPLVKVILISGYSQSGQAASLIGQGCRAFVQKPFQIEELARTIRRVLDGP